MMTTRELAEGPKRGIPLDDHITLWIPALPIAAPLIWRVRDAWAVLCGRAQAIMEAETERTS